MGQSTKETLSVDCRPVRKFGNSVGQTFDKTAMEKLGIVDEDGNFVDGVEATQKIYSDGSVEIEIDIDD